ncbi:MAG: o-succinylbenzoate synthase [Actinomycetota bacterium]
MKLPFRGITRRRGVVVRGPHGWGEFSVFDDYTEAVASRWAEAAVEAAETSWPAPVRERVAINVTVPAIDAGAAHELVKKSGCSTAKVKVGSTKGGTTSARDDEARIEAVRQALGPSGRLRIDANESWDIDTARSLIVAWARYDLEYVEQPVASLEDMAALRRSIDVPIAADELVRQGDPRRVKQMEAADLIVLKVQPLGGVARALQIAEIVGLPAVVSSAIETSVGIAAGLALAACLPDLPYACGLGTVSLLTSDLVTDPLIAESGWMRVRRPEPDEELLRTHSPDSSEANALVERFAALTGARVG